VSCLIDGKCFHFNMLEHLPAAKAIQLARHML